MEEQRSALIELIKLLKRQRDEIDKCLISALANLSPEEVAALDDDTDSSVPKDPPPDQPPGG